MERMIDEDKVVVGVIDEGMGARFVANPTKSTEHTQLAVAILIEGIINWFAAAGNEREAIAELIADIAKDIAKKPVFGGEEHGYQN